MPKSRLVLISLWALAGFLAPSACSVSDDDAIPEGECLFGPTCGFADGGTLPSTETLVDASGADQSDASLQGELCGVGSCLPEDLHSCDVLDDGGPRLLPEAGSAASLEAGPVAAHLLIDGAASIDGSALDAGVPAAADAGASPDVDASDNGAGSGALDSGISPGETPEPVACQIVGSAEQPERRCLPAGSTGHSQSCDDASECAPGLTCIAEAGEGHCLPYCCSGNDVCEAGSYCAPRPALRDGHARPVPVCVAADNCPLDEGFPCAGDACVCRTGTACTVVRGDGTTSCVPPGRGLDGDECPCAAGYFCSPTTGMCLQICELEAAADTACLAGHCQMAAGFPEGWGVCVGATSER